MGTTGGRRVCLGGRLGRSHRKLHVTDSQMQQVISELEWSWDQNLDVQWGSPASFQWRGAVERY